MTAVAPVDPMLPVPFALTERTRESHDTFTFELSPPDGAFGFVPGQFNMLYAFGVGEAAISISGDPTRPERLVHTIRAVGSVTRALERMEPGDMVGVRGPFGSGWPVGPAEGGDLVIIAGGIGLAPLRPVVYHAVAHRDRYDKVVLIYGTRSPQDILYDEELMAWRGRFDLDVEVTVDRGDGSWRGKTGVVTRLLDRAEFDPERATAMICGPEIMMRYAARELVSQGMGHDRIYITLERNMQCAVALCGHCQLGRELICRDGPVYRYDRVAGLLGIREL
ncbi:MAG: FAD/NAD(P)-binding protein [Polyangiaceae bacterium]